MNAKRLLSMASVAALLPLCAFAETLTVASWGGSYLRSQMLGFIRDFEEATGVRVEIVEYAGGIDPIRSQVRSYNVRWDVVDLELFDAIRANEEGLLLAINPEDLEPGSDGTPPTEDFIDGSLFPFGVGNILFSMVFAYNEAHTEKDPTSIADFFDLRKFPGERALRRTPVANLEWALLADGVPPAEVYPTLETDVGLQRAFRKLDRIKAVTRWWTDGEQPVAWLESGDVAFASLYHGRAYSAAQRGSPLAILWDRQITYKNVWGIPRNVRNPELALKFVRFATSTESLGKQTRYMPYGPMRQSSLELVPDEVRAYLPTSDGKLEQAFTSDPAWWSKNLERIQPRFDRWLRTPTQVPERLRR
ncbi:MAG: ABC transporter substrate-binding protein [Opitutales bacterium]|nr:ABC transporter substrate-binding protein [Opitutales bacterium]